ncbi:MAG: DNA polymerase I, partial [Thermoanaerobaculia bacterium]
EQTMAGERQRLFLIDGFSNIFRAFYAIRNLSNSKGEPTNAVYGFVQMLRKLLREDNPELVGVALDVSGETVRSEKFEDYKANRAPMPEDLVSQVPWIRKAIEAHNIPILEEPRYEADDVLGTLAKKAAAAGYEVVLVSSDKDLMQLVDENVSFYHTGRDKLYSPATVEEDFGVPPERVVDVLALKGDAVDNVPGVPGIGDKGAIQLIKEFGSLDQLLERADEVKRKSYREGLQEHRDLAVLSHELVTIHTDLPIEFEAEALQHDPPDRDALEELYREMEFFTLLEELKSTGETELLPAAEELVSPKKWSQRTAELAGQVFAAVVGDKEPVGLAAGGSSGPVFYADFRRQGMAEAVAESLERWLVDAELELAGDDLKEVLRLSVQGPSARALLFDTMLASYLLRSALRAHTLEELALDRLGHKALSPTDAGWGKGLEPEPGLESLLAYAGERVELVRRLEERLRRELEEGGLAEVYWQLEAPLLPVLVGMEETGVLLDTEFLAKMSEELGSELVELEKEIYELAGERFNINSPRQLGEIMFDKLGYPVLKKTRKTKSYSTSAETLQELAIRGFPLPEQILRYRELAKLKSTYVDALPALVDENGRLHTRFNQAVAATGRLSSANPNLQNIPVRTETGQQIRKAFVAPGGRQLLVADYNQIELRVLAHIAEEPSLIEAFAAGQDIHRSTAASVFGATAELVTAEQRRAAKAINFGIIYGISPFGLARNLGIPQPDAKAFIDAYLERYGEVGRYMEETLALAEEEGKVETLYGRIRWLPDIKSKNFNLRENSRRMAINARIQGTAADLLKKAMIAIHRRLLEEHPETHLILTVHDELVFEVPDADIEEVSQLAQAEMESVDDLRVPLVVDLGHGPTWYDAKT